MTIKIGDVWFANFPYEEDQNQTSSRPVIVLNVEPLEVLSVKITTHKPRNIDIYDIPIVYWKHASLHFESTARISKTIMIPKTQFSHKIGELHQDDLNSIQNTFMKFIKDNT